MEPNVLGPIWLFCLVAAGMSAVVLNTINEDHVKILFSSSNVDAKAIAKFLDPTNRNSLPNDEQENAQTLLSKELGVKKEDLPVHLNDPCGVLLEKAIGRMKDKGLNAKDRKDLEQVTTNLTLKCGLESFAEVKGDKRVVDGQKFCAKFALQCENLKKIGFAESFPQAVVMKTNGKPEKNTAPPATIPNSPPKGSLGKAGKLASKVTLPSSSLPLSSPSPSLPPPSSSPSPAPSSSSPAPSLPSPTSYSSSSSPSPSPSSSSSPSPSPSSSSSSSPSPSSSSSSSSFSSSPSSQPTKPPPSQPVGGPSYLSQGINTGPGLGLSHGLAGSASAPVASAWHLYTIFVVGGFFLLSQAHL